MAGQWPSEADLARRLMPVVQAATQKKQQVTQQVTATTAQVQQVASSVQQSVQQQSHYVDTEERRVVAAVMPVLQQRLAQQTGGFLDSVIDAASQLLERVTGYVGGFVGGVENIAGSVIGQLGTAAQGLVPNLASLAVAWVEGLVWAVTSLLDNMADTSEVLDVAIARIRENASDAAVWLADTLAGGLGVGLSAFLTNLELELPSSLGDLLERLARTPGVPAELAAMARDLRPGRAPWQAAVVLAVLSVLVGVLASAIASVSGEWLRQETQKRLPLTLPDPSTASAGLARGFLSAEEHAEALARAGYSARYRSLYALLAESRASPAALVRLRQRGWLSFEHYQRFMRAHGYDVDQAELEFRAAAGMLSETEIRDGYLRGVIDDAEHDRQLRAFGLTDDLIALRKQLYWLIPPPADLVRMSVREAFSDEAARVLDLDAEFPEEFARWAERVGLSRDWARRYWRAHWVLPSPTQAFEMLHRGLITIADLDALLKAADYAPRWREPLREIAYTPLTRVDIRRMHRTGVLSDAELTRAYQDIGYNAENAARLAEFTRRLNVQEHDEAIEPFRAGLKTRVVSAFINGVISDSDATFALRDLGYTDAQVDAFIAEARLHREVERAEAMREALRRKFVAGYLDWNDAAAQLAAAGFGPEEIDWLRPVWSEQRDLRELTDEERQARDLTKAELLSAYSERLLNSVEALEMLRASGYSQTEAALLLALQDAKDARATQNALREAIRARYRRGQITLAEASAQLDQLGLRAEHRDALLARWEAQHADDATPVPVATIRDLFRAGYISESRALTLLEAQAWPADVTAGIIALWKRGRGGGP